MNGSSARLGAASEVHLMALVDGQLSEGACLDFKRELPIGVLKTRMPKAPKFVRF